MGLSDCCTRGLSVLVPAAEPLLCCCANVEPEETLHRGLLQSWEEAAGCCAPATGLPFHGSHGYCRTNV